MCDTLVALPGVTAQNTMVFAKNSDRDPNEAHHVILRPSMEYQPGEELQCTYITIPQVRRIHKVLLAKPFWMWGAEMGVNEFGVVIGNEAVFSKVPAQKEPALTGMDLLRLGLERAVSAKDALNIITTLLEKYGQGGNGGFDHPFYYHNTYLIADAEEAWILETIAREWVARQVFGFANISNALTIEEQWEAASSNVGKLASVNNWDHRDPQFNFAKVYTDPLFTYFSHSKPRQTKTNQMLSKERGQISAHSMFRYLRHHEGMNENWSPDKALTGTDVCMHYGCGPIRINQTTGSLVVEVSADGIQGWYTGTSAPCTSIFKPFWFDAGLPSQGIQPTGIQDPSTIFWEHEVLHRAILQDYPTRMRVIQEARDQMESEFQQGVLQRQSESQKVRYDYSTLCLEAAREATRRWAAAVQREPVQRRNAFYFSYAWKKQNIKAALQNR